MSKSKRLRVLFDHQAVARFRLALQVNDRIYYVTSPRDPVRAYIVAMGGVTLTELSGLVAEVGLIEEPAAPRQLFGRDEATLPCLRLAVHRLPIIKLHARYTLSRVLEQVPQRGATTVASDSSRHTSDHTAKDSL
jgi:hypothetical protein